MFQKQSSVKVLSYFSHLLLYKAIVQVTIQWTQSSKFKFCPLNVIKWWVLLTKLTKWHCRMSEMLHLDEIKSQSRWSGQKSSQNMELPYKAIEHSVLFSSEDVIYICCRGLYDVKPGSRHFNVHVPSFLLHYSVFI